MDTIISPANQKITDLSSESATLSTSPHTSISSNEQDSSAVSDYPHKKQQTQDLIEIYQPIGRCNDQHKVDLDEDADGKIFATFHLSPMDSIRLPADSNIMIALAIWVYGVLNIVQRFVIFDHQNECKTVCCRYQCLNSDTSEIYRFPSIRA